MPANNVFPEVGLSGAFGGFVYEFTIQTISHNDSDFTKPAGFAVLVRYSIITR